MSKSMKLIEKDYIASTQLYRCANKPGSNLRQLEGYLCPSWSGSNGGSFDEAGYYIRRITQRCVSKNNNEPNLKAAICPSCNSCKNIRSRRNTRYIKKDFGDDISSYA